PQPAPHSFPTRRSSDLPADGRGGGAPAAGRGPHGPITRFLSFTNVCVRARIVSNSIRIRSTAGRQVLMMLLLQPCRFSSEAASRFFVPKTAPPPSLREAGARL